MGLSRTISEMNGDLNRKLQFFPTNMYFEPPSPDGKDRASMRRAGKNHAHIVLLSFSLVPCHPHGPQHT